MALKYPPIADGETVIDDGFWLEAANAEVRRYCGWHIAPVVTEQLVLDGSGGNILLLPTQKLVSLNSVFIEDEEIPLDRFHYSPDRGTLDYSGWFWPRFPVGSIRLNMTHGYDLDDVPDVVAVISAVATRARTTPAGVVSQTVAGASVSYATDRTGAALTVGLLGSEAATLNPFRLQLGV